jgi:hypothetical protein
VSRFRRESFPNLLPLSEKQIQGRTVGKASDSPKRRKTFFHPGVRAALLAFVVFAFLIVTDQVSVHYGLKDTQRVLDDLFGGIIAGLLIYRLESARSKYLNEKLKTIELMNHHVRNALQVIVDSLYVHGSAEPLDEIRDSVKRIEWALREILPGQILDQYEYEEPKPRNRPAA